jgi:uncharacterized protein (TIGR03435 family)
LKPPPSSPVKPSTGTIVLDFQVSGGPKWMDDDRYDLNAKAEGAASGRQLDAK